MSSRGVDIDDCTRVIRNARTLVTFRFYSCSFVSKVKKEGISCNNLPLAGVGQQQKLQLLLQQIQQQ